MTPPTGSSRTNTPVGRVTVSCLDAENRPARHTIVLHSDGTVTIPDHNQVEWTVPFAVQAALGGPTDQNPCIWWRDQADPLRTVTATRWDSSGHLEPYLGVLFNPFDWQFDLTGEWTNAAADVVWRAYGVSETLNYYMNMQNSNDRPTVVTPDRAIPYLDAITRGGRTSGYIYRWLVLDVVEHLSLDALTAWLDAGVPVANILPFRDQGIEPELAAHIVEAVENLRRANINKGTFADGGAPTVLPVITQYGIDADRIPGFLNRTVDAHPVEWRGDLRETITVPPNTPATWVNEAILSIPQAHLFRTQVLSNQQRYTEDNGLFILDDEWFEAWVTVCLPDRMSGLFAEHGDPNNWPNGWYWPNEEDKRIDWRERMTYA